MLFLYSLIFLTQDAASAACTALTNASRNTFKFHVEHSRTYSGWKMFGQFRKYPKLYSMKSEKYRTRYMNCWGELYGHKKEKQAENTDRSAGTDKICSLDNIKLRK